ncbi:hypothetical protein GDO86_013516 [Hymenochirus boettgeri]|uniref:Taste receptor type 2 n=1 Tax=Hymenochirus boettgeri TaxID=247094 RepID=A0A8T2IUH5_9PIPI|nr:hypothetical protein GDO86_013516 [Hymenochirus boettgeri]
MSRLKRLDCVYYMETALYLPNVHNLCSVTSSDIASANTARLYRIQTGDRSSSLRFLDMAEILFPVVLASLGLFGNGYILGIISKIFVRNKKGSPQNILLLCLGSLNVALQLTLTSNSVCSMFWPMFYNSETPMKTFFLTTMFLSLSSLLTSTWMSIYCSLKITVSQHKFIIKIKQLTPILVPCALIGSVLLSALQSILGINDIYLVQSNITYMSHGSNRSWTVYSFNSRCLCTLWIYTIIASVAFGLLVVATVIILHSLLKHVRKMDKLANIFRNPKTSKLLPAARTIILILLTCLSFFLCQFLTLTQLVSYGTPQFSVCLTIISMFPTMSAFVLISGNAKLKRPLMRLLFKPMNRT